MCAFCKNLTGQRFGKLVAIERVGTTSHHALWRCKCDCGNETETISSSLIKGITKSCGCLNKQFTKNLNYTHGMTNTRLFRIWTGMHNRCNNSKDDNYSYYGGRGITICDEWSEFLPFYNWAMSNGYKVGLTIDRINNNGNYEASNCRWTTAKAQANNRRNNLWYEFRGQTKTISQWSTIYNLQYDSIYTRVKKYGWSIEKALLTPVKIRKSNVNKEKC